MARTRNGVGFTALKVEGGILPPEFLTEVAALEAPRQRGTDYGLSKSLAIKEEIARYWRIGNDLYSRYVERRPRRDLPASRVAVDDWLVPFLRTLLGYDDLAPAGSVELEDRVFRLSHRACGGAVPLLLVTHDFDLDKADSRLGGNGRRLAPHGLMQEYLNAEVTTLWGMVSNGSRLRILRDNPSLTRPSYIEADLDLVFTEELYPDFAALWLATHASRFRPAGNTPSSCIIETWRAKAHETGERARENLRDGVTAALRRLGNGFLEHPANAELRRALDGGDLTPEDYFQQLLRLVYRFLFLFTAEERDLLHAPDATGRERDVYAEGYALSRLRERALRRRHYDRGSDLWKGLQVTFVALAQGAPALGVPPLGGLYREDECPDLDKSAIANEDLLEAVRSLAYFPSLSGRSLARINYRDMDTEELGSVYESLLELQPVIDVHSWPWRFAFASDRSSEKKTKGSARKLSGSYYTPPSLVGELVRTTLDPVIARAVADRPDDPREAILNLRVLDPACGSGHFLLAAARRLAAEIARIEAGADMQDEKVRQHALREVVRHCIYGVDRNPLAVELCKAALWIETIEPGKPLTFLDAQITLGDSLIGVLDPEITANGIPAAAYKPLTGDNKGVCTDLRARNRGGRQGDLFDEEAVLEVAVASVDLDSMPEDTLEEVERKRSAWRAARRDRIRAREALKADLFAGAFFAPKTARTLKTVPISDDLQRGGSERGRVGVEAHAGALSDRHRFLHWHLAFAEIMQDGGFDAVLGNPPWERVKLQEKEFFASRSPEIAGARNKAARTRLIRHLNRDGATAPERALFQEFRNAKREAEAASQFVRTGGRFPLTGVGDVNTYAVFAETCLQLINPKGRAGLIVPTGIATDHSTRRFFEHIVNTRRLATLYDFENREAVFPGVHRSYKFCLLTLAGCDDPVPEAEFAFFLYQVEHLKELERRFTLSAEDFQLFNPNTRTCPIFRTRRDMEIARKMYRRAGVFWKEKRGRQPGENPWGVSFQRMFDMSNDAGLFKTRRELEEEGWELDGNVFVSDDGEECYLPLYEAKLFHQYDHRFATFDGASKQDIRNGKARPMTTEEKADPASVVIPRYWVPETEVAKRLDKGRKGTHSIDLSSPAARQPGSPAAGHSAP
ncbi:MAG: N-6 DNA methylase, partial [Gemmatimonadetes bacterium]|nr:N-6 DNA methylase [Gemmatimonadota bacterium]